MSCPAPVVPRHLYHATPLYRFDPAATSNHGSWSVEKHGSIKGVGLIPRRDSSTKLAAVYLASEAGVAENYASGNFGEEWAVDWVVLEIETATLNPELFAPDLDIEAQTAAEDFVAAGYSVEDVLGEQIPWNVAMEVTGQVKYTGIIPDSSIRVFKTLRA
jgi:hypothetical protein